MSEEPDQSLFEVWPFVRYDPLTGEILEHGHMAHGHINALNDQGHHYFPDAGTHEHFFDTKEFKVTLRGNCPAVLHGMSLYNCPVPSKLVIGASTYEVTEPTVDLGFEHPGTYKVEIYSVKFMPGEFTVVVP